MAIKKAKEATPPKEKDELLDELAGFLYDAYKHGKEKDSGKIVLEKGQIAENEDSTKQ